MSAGFAKLDGGIVDSTLWMQPHDVLRVWVAMLAKASRTGFVRASVPSMAHLCMVPIERLEQILAMLMAPDPYSRTSVDEGRRLRAEEGGWQLINYLAYRNTRDDESRREQQREWDRLNRPSGHARQSGAFRQQSDSPTGSDDTRKGPTHAEAEAEAEAKKQDQERQPGDGDEPPEAKPKRDSRRGTRLPDGWQPSDAVREWAKSAFPAVSIDRVLAEFVDYWRAIPGKTGTKLDWDATFRNRIRTVGERAPRGNYAPTRESAADRSARLAREGDDRDHASGIER